MVRLFKLPFRTDEEIERDEARRFAFAAQGNLTVQDENRRLKDMVAFNTDELRRLRFEITSLRRSILSIKNDLVRLKQRSDALSEVYLRQLEDRTKDRANRIRKSLGLDEDPTKVDGFGKIVGILADVGGDENAVELLHRYRDED